MGEVVFQEQGCATDMPQRGSAIKSPAASARAPGPSDARAEPPPAVERTREDDVPHSHRARRGNDAWFTAMNRELCTPLKAMLGILKLLSEEMYGPLSERQLWALSQLEESGQHLLKLIHEVLDVAKIRTGRGRLELDAVSLEDLCQSSLRKVEPAALGKDIALTLRLEDADAYLVADERRLRQVLVKLLSNAVQFTPPGGAVGLDVRVAQDSGTLHMVVWDTGIGISPQDQTRLFQPFVQLEASQSLPSPRTGLGLALVRQIVGLHGGEVHVESELRKGSRFVVSLPQDSRLPGPEASPRREPLPRVLLADGDESNLRAMCAILESCGVEVSVVRDGLRAVVAVRELRPDLIVMDAQMPGLDGLSAMHAIRASSNPHLRAVPIVALTALGSPGDRERFFAAEAHAHLSKPVSTKALLTTVQRLLRRSGFRMTPPFSERSPLSTSQGPSSGFAVVLNPGWRSLVPA